jgi:hypothetical protein
MLEPTHQSPRNAISGSNKGVWDMSLAIKVELGGMLTLVIGVDCHLPPSRPSPDDSGVRDSSQHKRGYACKGQHVVWSTVFGEVGRAEGKTCHHLCIWIILLLCDGEGHDRRPEDRGGSRWIMPPARSDETADSRSPLGPACNLVLVEGMSTQ